MNDLYVCDNCGCVDCLSLNLAAPAVTPGAKFLCSECLPVGVAQGGFAPGTGKWHGRYPKRAYDPTMDLVVNRPTGLGLGA